jgi:hypothetical protein
LASQDCSKQTSNFDGIWSLSSACAAALQAVQSPVLSICDSTLALSLSTHAALLLLSAGIMIGINGAFPASGDAFSVTPVEGVARQLEVAIGETCKAKYLLDDALFAKLDGETVKNSATGKAASFLAAVLALLAMLVL